ncbi:MAG: riboflavin biosynthesis protein RibF [Terracidiphilus sp.]
MSMGAAGMIPLYRSVTEIPAEFGPSVGAIGNFDGVHRGHRRILSAVVDEARTLRMRAVAITFDPHPQHFLRPEEAPRLITPIAERLRLLAATGVDAVVVLPFDAELAGLSAREFVRAILVQRLSVHALHEGGNFRFGHRAEAGAAELKEFGAEFGFQVHLHAALRAHGMEVSSSAIRALISAGDVRRARWMLGRPFGVKSTPAKGRGVGTKLLVPTVNLAVYGGLLPGFGVFVTRLTVQTQDGARCFHAVTNVGNRPTFEGAGFGVETHILDFEPVELTDETRLELEFLMRLRGEKTWPSPEALREQIFRDVARAKRFFRLAR